MKLKIKLYKSIIKEILDVIDVSKIPNIKFYADPCYEYGVYTYNHVPYSTVVSTQEMKFNK